MSLVEKGCPRIFALVSHCRFLFEGVQAPCAHLRHCYFGHLFWDEISVRIPLIIYYQTRKCCDIMRIHYPLRPKDEDSHCVLAATMVDAQQHGRSSTAAAPQH
eukprot:scaffold80305_cov68-Cyclotella_meneghiniana.AAC.2